MAMYMYHFTKDGEYVDGVDVTMSESNDTGTMKKFAQTYEGCHSWVMVNEWMSMVAIALPYDRWTPELEANVPECVRLAEYVRDKS